MTKKGYIEFTDPDGERRRLSKEYFRDKRSYDQLQLGKSVGIPTLIIVGDRDRVISIKSCEELFQTLPVTKKELVLLENEDHLFHNKANKLLNPVLDFLRSA